MLRYVAVFIALLGCSSRKAPLPEAIDRQPIVPDAVMSQLGDIGFALAVDLHSLDLTAVSAMIPDAFSCARDIARTAKIAVITAGIPDTWEGRFRGIAEASSRDCLTTIGNSLGISVTATGEHSATINAEKAVSVQWRDGDMLVAEKGAPMRSGVPPGVITDLLASVPHNVQAWLVTSGAPAHKLKRVAAWLEATPTTWRVTAHAESTQLGAARPWAESIIGSFTAAAQSARIPVDAHWFSVESTPTTAKLVATIPLAAFVPQNQ